MNQPFKFFSRAWCFISGLLSRFRVHFPSNLRAIIYLVATLCVVGYSFSKCPFSGDEPLKFYRSALDTRDGVFKNRVNALGPIRSNWVNTSKTFKNCISKILSRISRSILSVISIDKIRDKTGGENKYSNRVEISYGGFDFIKDARWWIHSLLCWFVIIYLGAQRPR